MRSFIDNVNDELELQLSLRGFYEKELKCFPEGSLITKKRSNSCCEHYLYTSADDAMQYLGKKDLALISQLRQKKIYESGLKALNNNIPMLDKLVRNYMPYDYIPLDSKPAVPAASDICSRNRFRNDGLIYLTSAGIYVRSKGEAIIVDVLWQRGIPFFYEKALALIDENGNVVIVYPDFTIPISKRSFLVWEHNGMLLNEDYRKRSNRKMHLYFINGFYQPKNLIITSDGPNGEFSIPDIHRIVDGLILPLL